jgi:hypothetical protein
MTVFHNGVLVQDAAELWGETNWLHFNTYAKHADALPITLQDHDHPVRYRNIWVRPLPDLPTDERGAREAKAAVALSPAVLDRFVGSYGTATDKVATVTRRGGRLFINPFSHRTALALVPQSATRFVFVRTAGTVEFVSAPGKPIAVTVKVAGLERSGEKRP